MPQLNSVRLRGGLNIPLSVEILELQLSENRRWVVYFLRQAIFFRLGAGGIRCDCTNPIAAREPNNDHEGAYRDPPNSHGANRRTGYS
jgi:hypothetical protein